MRCEFFKSLFFKKKIDCVTVQCWVILTLEQLSSIMDGAVISFKKKKALLRYGVLTIESIYLYKVYKSVTFNIFVELYNISVVQF